MKLKGIDVSSHQGQIRWEYTKKDIDFAIIRLGYGSSSVDKYAFQNMKACMKHNIPFGVYWFSYAYTEQMARIEARTVIEKIKGYKLSYPIFFDYEYDSVNYAKSKGKTITPTLAQKIVKAFCEEIEKNGLYVGVYSNEDFIDRYFGENIFDKYDLWYANWNKSHNRTVNMWQYTCKGAIAGIEGAVDCNYCYVDYPTLIKGNTQQYKTIEEVAKCVLNGEYGDGSTRMEKLKKEGYDYYAVQGVINKWYAVARDCINGKYGNGETRKKKLTSLGYPYDIIQSIVNDLIYE